MSPADSTGYYNDAPLPVDSNAQYTASQLADQHNVVQCPDCTKPVLESALAQHAGESGSALTRSAQEQAVAFILAPELIASRHILPTVNCQRIRDRAQQQMGEGGRKRRMSDGELS